MISTPFSAWTLRIENMRSCLRIVDAPSTPISSAMATSSAGVFFFSSFKCIGKFFSWGVGLASQEHESAWAAGRRDLEENVLPAKWETGRKPSRFEVCLPAPAVNQKPARQSPKRLKGTDDHQHHDDRRGDTGNLVEHAHRLARQRTLALREFLAVSAEPALIAAQQNDAGELRHEPALVPGVDVEREHEAEDPDDDHRGRQDDRPDSRLALDPRPVLRRA